MSKPAERNVHNADTPDFSVPNDGHGTPTSNTIGCSFRLPDRQTNHGSLAAAVAGTKDQCPGASTAGNRPIF